ncbi:MAG: hypothetical protein HC822_21195 [Oscillochloris sp.]|nr:hypothetical protein [Oscillochloris sp.]
MSSSYEELHSLVNQMLQAARAKSGDELLLVSIDQVLSKAKPRQAQVLRRCAVPRWIDAGVLRILREGDEGNERILDKLRDYSFVRDLGDGRLAYHTQVREALLEEWSNERPAELADLHRRLYRYFNDRTTPPGSRRMPTRIMPESDMLNAIPISVQADMFRREAIYHLLNADPDAGMEALERTFDEIEQAHRSAEAEQLLQVAGEVNLSPSQRLMLRHMRARTLQMSLSLEEATQELEELQAEPNMAPELAAQVSRSLGEVYAETGRWALATDLYKSSLSYFQAHNERRAAAETMLLLGEAYQNLGFSTGSWHVPGRTTAQLMLTWQRIWIWLIGLPFQMLILLLGSKRPLPLASYCARYQNWLLIRLYNTARHWYDEAYQAFKELNDRRGMVRAAQRQADILQIYGYPGEARARLEQLRAEIADADIYWRAWIDRSLAECHLAEGDIGSAQILLAEALRVFQELGDVRREAAVRTLQGQAALYAGDVEGALAGYQAGLDRYRTLRYATARERILHELRAWQRRPGISAGLVERLERIIAAEPEKRYVGRFIRSAAPLLQIGLLLALPLAMLILAVVVPVTETRPLPVGGVLTLDTSFDPLRTISVLATLAPIYLLVYAALGVAVIFLLPLSAIEREQPDVIVTRPDTITRYNSKGRIERTMQWTAVRRWVALDRCVWDRPLALYSRTYLEDETGYDLGIDGITGWYNELQYDIGRRLTAVGQTITRHDLGYSLVRSLSGISFMLGIVLLIIFSAAENNWLSLVRWLPSEIYSALAYVAFSGSLILIPLAYWIANRPLALQRTLQLTTYWPWLIGVLGAAPVVSYLISDGNLIPVVKALNYSTFVWGSYLLAEAVASVTLRQRTPRIILVSGITLLALAWIAQPAYGNLRWQVAYTAKNRAATQAALGEQPTAVSAQAREAADQAIELGADPFSALLFKGDSYAAEAAALAADGQNAAAVAKWRAAAEGYLEAVSLADSYSEQVLALYNLALAADQAGEQRLAFQARESYSEICNQEFEARQICTQIFGRIR